MRMFARVPRLRLHAVYSQPVSVALLWILGTVLISSQVIDIV